MLRRAAQSVANSRSFRRCLLGSQCPSDAQPRLSAARDERISRGRLAAAGSRLYGVMSSAARRRTRDIGVRVALGATPREVRRLVLGEGVGVVGVGACAGIAGAIFAGRLLASQLFGV